MNIPDPRIPVEELDRRIAGLQTALSAADVALALIVQNVDRYYFSGTLQDGVLAVPAQGQPLLLIRKSLDRARRESALNRIEALPSPKALGDQLERHGLTRCPRTLGLEMDVLPATLYEAYGRTFPGAERVDVSMAIRTIRAVKSEWELDRIREAARCADQVAALAAAHIRPGRTEIEIAGGIEAEARRLGHQGLVRMRMFGGELFYGHFMAGPSTTEPSFLASPTGGMGVSPAMAQGAGWRPVARGEPILLDYVFVHDGYIADHTRIFCIGPAPVDVIRAHAAMCEIESTLLAETRPGVTGGQLYDLAVARADALGYGRWFLGAEAPRITFVGHGVGLELDELPVLAKGQRTPLVPGMVIAVEPKAVIPGIGVVGVENTHQVTAHGIEPLTRLPSTIIEI